LISWFERQQIAYRVEHDDLSMSNSPSGEVHRFDLTGSHELWADYKVDRRHGDEPPGAHYTVDQRHGDEGPKAIPSVFMKVKIIHTRTGSAPTIDIWTSHPSFDLTEVAHEMQKRVGAEIPIRVFLTPRH
jgi:hypothetical protein